MSYYTREEYIRDFHSHRILGILRTLANGDIEAREFNSRRILGYYRAKQDVTTDFFGRRIAKGNCVTSLIFNKKRG